MIATLIIKNFAIIDRLEIEFHPRFNIITGETGAGKSIVIGALQFLLGMNADKDAIRADTNEAEVSGIFHLPEREELRSLVQSFLADTGVEFDTNGELIVKRILRLKTVRNFINATPVPVSVLKQMGELLMDAHGPNDHQSLIKPHLQLSLIDDYAALKHERKAVRDCFHRRQSLNQEIDNLQSLSLSPAESDLLQFQIQEIRQLQLKENEEDELKQQHLLIANRQKITDIIRHCLQTLDGNQGVQERLAFCQREFLQLEKIDSLGSNQFTAPLETTNVLVQQLIDDLNSYLQSIDFDSQTAAKLEERLSAIYSIKRKYGGSIKAALDYAVTAEQKIERWANVEKGRQELLEQLGKVEGELQEKASQLSGRRQQAISQLSPMITDKLHYLGFNGSKFAVQLTEVPISATGKDAIEFKFAPNLGEGSKPLRNIASSGEISRIMLAIKTTLAKADQIPLMIFDEIDANIGGEVAGKVGKELAQLGCEHQIICITHLPQVAAGADRHFLVEKLSRSDRTTTHIQVLDQRDQINEIARMMGSVNPSKTALSHAAELIARQKADFQSL